MESSLKSYLDKNKIEYKNYKHPAVFSVEESKKIKLHIPSLHTKCLFLKDEHSQFYLICLSAEKRLDTNLLRRKFNLKELYFASEKELKANLNLTPGSVSLFGMIHSNSVFLIIDKDIWESDAAGFHPNINTATLVLDHSNLEKFYNSLKVKKEIISL